MLFRTAPLRAISDLSRNVGGMSFRKHAAGLLFSLTMIFALVEPGWSQISSTVLGTIADPQGNVIVGATVTLTNEGTGEQRLGTTEGTGSFSFPSVLAGTYTVKVE